MPSRIPVIAIVGRPNVGKSTLFNRIVGSDIAIVEDVPGVTRDRNYALVDRYAVTFMLVDTGGFERDPGDEIAQAVVTQTKLAIEEADVVLVLFDGKTGRQPGDDDVVELLRRSTKPVFYCVNKCDGAEQEVRKYDFYSLGCDPLWDASALHGRNVERLLHDVLSALPDYEQLASEKAEEDRAREEAAIQAREVIERRIEIEKQDEEEETSLIKEPVEFEEREPSFAPVYLPDEDGDVDDYVKSERVASWVSVASTEDEEDEVWGLDSETKKEELPEVAAPPLIKVAVVGKPNSGKSTLCNTLSGEARSIVSSIPGTTRDALDIDVTLQDQRYVLVDTAGLRKKGKIEEALERYSVLRTLRAVSHADVALLLIDAVEGPTDQDAKIAGLVHEQGKGLVIVINKWDLIEKNHKTVHDYTERVREQFKFAPYAPIIYTSARSGRRCRRLLEESRKIAVDRMKRVPTGRLNRTLQSRLRKVTAPSYRGRPIKLYYASQVGIAPPRFLLYFSQPKGVHFSYLRSIKNTIRESFGFEGTDIKLETRKGARDEQ